MFERAAGDGAAGAAAAAGAVLRAGAGAARARAPAARAGAAAGLRAARRPAGHAAAAAARRGRLPLRVDPEEALGEADTQAQPAPGRQRGAAARLGRAAGAAGGHAEAGAERHVGVQPAAVPAAAPAPLHRHRLPAARLLLRQGARGGVFFKPRRGRLGLFIIVVRFQRVVSFVASASPLLGSPTEAGEGSQARKLSILAAADGRPFARPTVARPPIRIDRVG